MLTVTAKPRKLKSQAYIQQSSLKKEKMHIALYKLYNKKKTEENHNRLSLITGRFKYNRPTSSVLKVNDFSLFDLATSIFLKFQIM